MEEAEIYGRIIEILKNHLGDEVDWDEINPAVSLREDLKADSLDMIDSIMLAEEEFGVEISDEDSDGVVTILDVVDLVKKKLIEKEAKKQSAPTEVN